MLRRDAVELLESPSLPREVVADAYRDLARLHRWLGNTAAVLSLLRREDPGNGSVRSVLDLGCGQGELLEELHRRLGVQVTGFDIRPALDEEVQRKSRILTGNAVADPMPSADAAIAVCLVHHLSEADTVGLIRNVARSCPRFIVLDLVRHWLPLWLFRIFVAPFLCRINAADGAISIQRAYTPSELRRLVDLAVEGTGARVRHTVAPFYVRQVIDICW